LAQILLVEDDAPMAALYERALLAKGYDVMLARGSQEATELLGRSEIDLVILDMTLPDAPGTLVLDYLEQQPDQASVLVIVMTGFARYLKQADRPCVVQLLSKPVTISHLVHAVEAALGDKDSN
jgi:DNA-binding NtrC family response regulator